SSLLFIGIQRPSLQSEGILELRRVFFHFRQVRLAAFDLAILFRPFGGKVFDRLGDLSLFHFILELFVDWTHNFSLPPLHATNPASASKMGRLGRWRLPRPRS